MWNDFFNTQAVHAIDFQLFKSFFAVPISFHFKNNILKISVLLYRYRSTSWNAIVPKCGTLTLLIMNELQECWNAVERLFCCLID